MIFIVALAVGALMFSAVVAIALARVAGGADREMERALADSSSATRVLETRQTYAGCDSAHAVIAFESSITVPSSNTRVGTRRVPVSSCTLRRPGIRLSIPGSGAGP